MFPHHKDLKGKTVLRKVKKIYNDGEDIKDWVLVKLPEKPEEGLVLLEIGEWNHNNKPSAALWRYNQDKWYNMLRPLTQLSSLAKLVGNLIDDTKREIEYRAKAISLSKKKKLAKEWGTKNGYHININKVVDQKGKEICMGWGELFDIKKREILAK